MPGRICLIKRPHGAIGGGEMKFKRINKGQYVSKINGLDVEIYKSPDYPEHDWVIRINGHYISTELTYRDSKELLNKYVSGSDFKNELIELKKSSRG